MNEPTKIDSLFSEFEKKTKKDWIELAIEDLKGNDYNKELVWNTPEGFPMDPFYTLEEMRELGYLKGYHNFIPNRSGSGTSPRVWDYIEKIHVGNEKKANSIAHEVQHMGADGIHFYIPGAKKIAWDKLMHQLYPNVNPVIIQSGHLTESQVEGYLSYLSRQGNFSLTDVSGGLNFDPLRDYSLTGKLEETGFDLLSTIIKATENMRDFKTLTVNGSQFLNSGSDTVHEIAFCMNVVVEYLDRLTDKGISIHEILNNLSLSLAVGTNYFMEIAKLRAIRIIFDHLIKSYGLNHSSAKNLKIHCDTAGWTKTFYDPHVNMLRNTTEAMAAILGGSNSLSIDPFDAVINDSSIFSRRMSRNISNLLKKESYFDKAVDPAAGSYYIESLTDKLLERSLEIFQQIESEGGFVEAFQKGLIQGKIAEIRDTKYKWISNRRMVMVGVNQYANPDEKINPAEAKFKTLDFSLSDRHLVPARASYYFELLRLNTDKYVEVHGEKKRPTVFLSLIGENKIMRKARADFAQGFFSCAGFRVIESSPSTSLFKSIQKAIDSRSDIVVMCGSDEDYLKNSEDYARAFKSNQKGILVLAGNPSGKIDALISAGIDDFIHIKTNVIDSLRQFQIRLKIIKA